MSINTVTSQGSIGFILAHSNEVMAHSSTKEFVVHGSILSRNDDDGESTQQQPTTTTTTSDDHVSSVAAASFSTVHTSFSCDGTLMAVLMVLPPTDVASHFSSSLSPSPLPCPTTTTVIGSDVINLLIEHVASGAQVALILAAESEDTTNIDRITSSRASDDGNGRRVAATCASFVPVPIQGGNAILTVGCQLQQQQQQQPMSSSIVLWHQRRSQHFSHTLEAQTVPFIALASVDGSTANGGVDVGHVTALAFCGAEDTTAGTIPCIRFATAACPTSSAPLSEFKVTVWRIATSSATCVGDESPQGSSGDNCIAIISEVSISDQFTGPLISSLALSQRHVAMGDSNGVIHVWKSPRAAATDGCCCMERVAELTAGHSQKHTIAAMAFSPNGNMLISGSSDSSIVAWDASNSAPTCITKLTVHNHHSAPTRYEVPHHSVVVSIAFHPGGHYFYTASTDNVVRRWDAAQLQSTPIKEHRRKTTADDAKALVDTIKLGHVAISPDGTVLASSLLVQASSLSSSPQDYFSRCIVTTELTGHLYRVASLVGHTGGITCIAIAPGGGESDGRRHHHHHVVTGSRDGTIRLWRGDSGRCISTSEGINSSSPVMVHCVAFSDDGRVIVATLADDNGTFEIRAFWTLERFSTGALLKVKHDEKLRSLTVTAHLMNNDDSDGTFGEQKAQLLQPTTAHNCYKITMIESFEGQSGIQEEGSSVAVFQMPAPTVPMITKLDITTKSSPRATTPIAAIFDVISAGPYLPVNDKKFVVKYFHEHILDNPHVERELRFVIQQNAALKHNNIIHLWALVEEVDNDGEEGCGHCNSTLTKRRHSSMSATGVTKQKRCSSGVRRIVGMVMEFCPSTLERFVAHSLPPTPSSGSFAFVGGSGVGSVVPMTNSPKRLGLDESGVMLESSLRKLGYLHDIASALAFAHSHNIIHSDVRPSNILIDVNDVAKLSDFSSAHVITKNSESFTGSRGSSLFTAPEYACGDTPPTVAADIFSFGMMVWWTMAIADPFDSHKLGRNDVQIALSLYHEKRPPIEHLLGDNLGSPIAGLATLVSDCWAHNPAERPASMDVVRQRLETVLVKCNAAGWGLASSVEGKENDDASSTTRASPVPDGGDLSLLVPPTTMNNVPLIHLSQLTVAKSPFVSDMTSSVYVAEITNHALQTTRHAFKRFHKPAWKLITAEINASLALLSQTQHVQQVARIAGIVVDFSANPTKITATSKSDESLAIGVLYEDEFEAALLPQSLIGRWSNDFIFSSKTLNYFFHQIASSLARAHERDIVHGDVNPNCILLAPTPPEMVLTVGAERSSIHYISKLTDFGSCEGKPQPMFVAPVAASKDDFDCDVMLGTPSKEADVFCFAMTMCYILSPIAIHEFSKTSIQMSMQLQNHQRPDLTNRGVPNELVELISRCWVDDPAKRPNINDVMETLTELLLVEAPSSSVTSPTTQQLRLSFSFPLSALQNSTDSLPVESQNIIVTLPQLGELKLLATGASSMVYKGKINLGGKETRDCAVKQLHVKNMSDITHSVMPIHEHGVLGTSSSPSSRQQKRKEYISLSREINVAYSLRHPHIVNVFALLVKSVITATTGEEKSIVISDENSNDIATASPPPTGPLIIDGIVMEYCEHGTLLSAAKKVFAGDKTAGMAAATKNSSFLSPLTKQATDTFSYSFANPTSSPHALEQPSSLAVPPLRERLDTQVIKWLYEAAAALSFAHSQGVVHGDVKPENILITSSLLETTKDVSSSLVAKLSDFGSSTTVRLDPTAQLPPASLVGTSCFIAPEVLLGKTGLTTAADVFSFGVTMWQVLFPSMMEEMGSSTSALKWYRSPERGERPPLPVFHDAEENSDSNQETKLWKRLCSMIEACWAQNSFSRPTMEGVMLDLRLLLEFRLQLDQASTASTKVEPTLWITQIWKPIFTDNDFFRTLTFSRAEGKLLSHFRCVTGDLNRGTYFEVALTDKMGMLANIVGMSYNEFILEHLRGSYGKDKLERCISKISKIVLIGVSDVRTRAFQMQRLAQRVSWEIGSSNGGDTAESDALRYLTKFHRICGPKTTQASPNEPSPVVLAWHGASVSELNALLSDGDLGDALVKDDHAGYFGYGSYFALEAEHAIRFVTPQPAAAVLYAVTYSRAYVVTPEKDYHVSTDQRFDRFSDFYHYNTETNEPSKVPLMQHCDAHIIPVKHYRRSEHPAPPRSQRTSGLEPAGPTTATTTTLTKHATAPPAAEPAATVKNNLDDGEELLCRENFQATREDEGRSSSPATTTYHEIVLRSRQQCIPIAVVYFTQQE